MTRDKMWKSTSEALFDSDLVATRWTLAFAELFWAIMLLWPGDTFDRPTYKIMSHVMSEEAWGFVLLLSSVLQMSIVIMKDYNSRFARYFAAVNAVLWSFVGCVSPLLSVSPPPAAMGGEFALALSAGWIWVRPYVIAVGYCRARKSTRPI